MGKSKMTGAEVLAAMGDGTVDPNDIVRLVSCAFQSVEEVRAEKAARALVESVMERHADMGRRLASVKEKIRQAEAEDVERKHREEREAADGTASRELAAQIRAISHLPQFNGDGRDPGGGDQTVIEG